MAIISTFDPKFQRRAIEENIKLYGKENIVHITKSKLFLWIKVILPFLFWLILLIAFITVVLSNIDAQWFVVFLSVLGVLLWLLPNIGILKLYLDYKMDFVVINPRAMVRYNQEWFFKRISKNIDLKDIRSVSIRRSWFLNSIFNNGNLVFLSEAWESEDDEHMRAWEIIFRYVYHPDLKEKKVTDLLAKI